MLPGQGWRLFVLGAAMAAASSAAVDAGPLVVATYHFNDDLNAAEAGAPTLTSVDPLGRNGFEDAVVHGVTQRVFHWDGTGAPALDQAGLTLDATGLVHYDSYSVALTFEFLEAAEFGGGRRRIVDTQDRQSDDGFYVEPDDHL